MTFWGLTEFEKLFHLGVCGPSILVISFHFTFNLDSPGHLHKIVTFCPIHQLKYFQKWSCGTFGRLRVYEIFIF